VSQQSGLLQRLGSSRTVRHRSRGFQSLECARLRIPRVILVRRSHDIIEAETAQAVCSIYDSGTGFSEPAGADPMVRAASPPILAALPAEVRDPVAKNARSADPAVATATCSKCRARN
jgi:hypothetical protein